MQLGPAGKLRKRPAGTDGSRGQGEGPGPLALQPPPPPLTPSPLLPVVEGSPANLSKPAVVLAVSLEGRQRRVA